MNNPLVSVLIISYNHEKYLSEAVYSVLNQTYKNIELIVVDDKSPDGSVQLLTELSKKEGFIFLPSDVNLGLNNNIARGIDNATGDFIAILASDDIMVPEKIEKQLLYLDQTQKDGVYATGFSLIDGVKKFMNLNPVFLSGNKYKILQYVYTHDWGAPLLLSGLFKQSIVKELVPMRKLYKSDDWAFLIKIYELFDIGFMNEALFYYRIHGLNMHKKYWFTLPIRLEVVSVLVPVGLRTQSIGNIMLSQGQYLLGDGKLGPGLKFFMSSICMNFSASNLILIAKSITLFVINKFSRKAKAN